MKEIEKLANIEVDRMCCIPVTGDFHDPEAVARVNMFRMGFETGFRKARELIAKQCITLGKLAPGENALTDWNRNAIGILEIGESEVKE